MVNVGIVGIGFMGMTHYRAYQNVRGAKVAAICTRDPKKLSGDWRGIKGNFGLPGSLTDLGATKRYANWEDLLNDSRIDLVDICLPPAQHPSVAIAALKAGKHVVCEKPIALNSVDAARMVKAAEQAGTLLFIAQVLPFFPEYTYALELVKGGKYGPLWGGHFKRIISDPLWIKDFYNPRTVGGPVIDLHIHDAHFIRLLCGIPHSVYSKGRIRGEVVEFVSTQFGFSGQDLTLTAISGVIQQQGRAFTHGFEIYLERATVAYDFAVVANQPVSNTPLTLLTKDGKASQPKLKGGDAFVAEITEVVKSVRNGKPSEYLGAGLALDALRICEAETRSVFRGQPVNIQRRS